MFPLELSLLDIALMAVVAIILTFYAIFLVKLKPTKEIDPTLERNFEKKGKAVVKLKKTEKLITPVEAEKITIEEAASSVENPKFSKESAEAEAHIETEENNKKKKDKEAKKSLFLFGKRDFGGCVHEFGYLRTVPKNTPIPDECFGCPRILECLIPSKSK